MHRLSLYMNIKIIIRKEMNMEKNKIYKVPPFIISSYDDFSVVQNSKSTVLIKDSTIAQYFKNVEESKKDIFKFNELLEIFEGKVGIVIDFCLKNNLIEYYEEVDLEYNDLFILSNDSSFIDSCIFNLDQIVNSKFLNYDKYGVMEMPEIPEKSLVTIFLNPFTYNDFLEISNKLSKDDITFRIAFYYEHRIYITNYYKKTWYNPCPICFFSNLRSALSSYSNVSGSLSFQNLLELIYEKDPGFKLQVNLNNGNILNLIYLISTTIDIDDNYKVNNTYVFDYINNIFGSDRAFYWDLCDCYEK